MQTLPLMKVYKPGPIITQKLVIIWNLSFKLSSKNFFRNIFLHNDFLFRIYAQNFRI